MRLVTLVRRVLDAAGNAGLSRKGRQEQAAGPDQDLDRHHSLAMILMMIVILVVCK